MARTEAPIDATATELPPQESQHPSPALRNSPNLPGVQEMSTSVITAVPVAVPRNEAAILAKLKVRAAAAGGDWYYRFPVKDNRTGRTSHVEGPSIKCANNVAQLYGNCAVRTRAIDNFDSWIIYARLEDLENGVVYERPWMQPKGQGTFRAKDQDRLEAMSFQIGVSKAIRNVICNALDFFTNYAFEEARSSIIETIGKDLPKSRIKLQAALQKLDVDIKRVEATVGRALDAWLAPDCARINAEIQAVMEGMATADETWPGDAPPKPTRESVKKAPPSEIQQRAITEQPLPPVTRSAPPVQAQPTGDQTGGAYEFFGADGALATSFEDPVDFVVHLMTIIGRYPANQAALLEANGVPIAVALEELKDFDHVAVHDLKLLIKPPAIEPAKKAEPEPEPAKPEELKPIELPKTAKGAIDVAKYVKAMGEEIGRAPDEAMVRRIMARERPNRALIAGADGGVRLHASRRIAAVGGDPNTDNTYQGDVT